YGTRAHPLRLNLISTHSLGHHSSGLGFVTSFSGKPKTHGLPKTLSKLERKYPKKYYSILEIKINVRILKINNKFSIYRLQKIVLADLSTSSSPSFTSLQHHRALCHWASCTRTKVECVPSANRQVCLVMRMLQLLRSFQPFCSILRLSVHASTKTSNT
ncbi:hypothetical protein H5410_057146, partial [Solanum commersonii]